MITQEFNINIIPHGLPPRVPINQYDVGLRTLIAHVYQDDTELPMTSAYTYTVVGTKPSGTGFTYSASVENGAIVIDVTAQMSVVAGPVRCGILIQSGDDVVGTLAFILDVQKAALTTDTIIDSDDFGSIITDAVVAWMDEHGVVIDKTLTVSGAGADAKIVGDKGFLIRGSISAGLDVNDMMTPGIYRKASNVTVTNWPDDLASTLSFLMVYPGIYSNSPVGIQVVMSGSYIFWRYNSTTSHGAWKRVASFDDVPAIDPDLATSGAAADAKTVGDYAFMVRGNIETGADINTMAYMVPGIYRKASSTTVTNWPVELASATSYLVSLPGIRSISPNGIQIVLSSTRMFIRYNASSTHGAWTEVTAQSGSGEVEYYVGPTRANTSLIGLFQTLAGNTAKKVIYIDPGEYDIFADYKANDIPSPDDDPDWGGSSYYEAYNSYVPVNTRLVGLGDVILKWDPTSDEISANEASVWSPINIHGNTELENLTIICNNGRYCVHDDVHNNSAYRGMYHKMKNCRLIRQNRTITSTSWVQCTGTALTDRCSYEFENCIFDTALAGPAWSCHDAPQQWTGRTFYDGATVVFNDCVFLSAWTAAMRFRAGSNTLFMRQKVNINGCYLNQPLHVNKTDTSSSGSYQPYDITLLRSGNPTINVDSGGATNPVVYTPTVYGG